MSRENVYEVFGVAEAVRGVRGGWFDVGEDVDEVISIRVMPSEGHYCGALFSFHNGRLSYAPIHRAGSGSCESRKIALQV